MKQFFLTALMVCVGDLFAHAAPNPSIARVWDEEILAAIRIDLPHPPVHARNLFHLSVAMYDAWAAYDTVAVGYLYHSKHTATDLPAARREAISYAGYRLLRERYALSRNATNTLAALDTRMGTLGYDRNNNSVDPSTPASKTVCRSLAFRNSSGRSGWACGLSRWLEMIRLDRGSIPDRIRNSARRAMPDSAKKSWTSSAAAAN